MRNTTHTFLFSGLLLTLLIATTGVARADVPQLMQLVDYVGADYADAVLDGSVVNEDEYREMSEFSHSIQALVDTLPRGQPRDQLMMHANELISAVAQKVSPTQIRALITKMRQIIVSNFAGIIVPRSPPNLARGADLYAEQCASCHGKTGDGRGPLAQNLEPPPINFLDQERASQRSLYGLYNTITLGVADTSMRPYMEMTNNDRWALAFFTGSLAHLTESTDANQLLRDASLEPLTELRTFITSTPSEVADTKGDEGLRLMTLLRSEPAVLFGRQSPLSVSRQHLDDVMSAYNAGDPQKAYRSAVAAYLDGFELVEQALDVVDSELRSNIEHTMTRLRSRIREDVSPIELEADIIAINQQLDYAQERLDGDNLSPVAAFSGAFLILIREGVEALLLVAAFAAFLVKTGHRSSLRYVHIGWLSALFAGALTWWISASLIQISGASRETTEGVAALFAAGVLFFVGFWLHSKSSSDQWQQFIQSQIQSNLKRGTLWGLAGLSFVAVYREVFETILFYQALWAQTDDDSKNSVVVGFVSGVGALLVIAFVILRASRRLPLRQFFGATSVLMLILAVVFAGKGVMALQEAGYLPMTAIAFPEVALLGLYPYLEGLILQSCLVVIGLWLWFKPPGHQQ